MDFSEKIQEIKEVGQLALTGVKDEVLAKQFNTSVWRIVGIRKALGIRRKTFKSIVDDWRSVYFAKDAHYAKFPLTRDMLDEMGFDATKQLKMKGKISGTKLVLEFKYKE